jgi:hypothetical protein
MTSRDIVWYVQRRGDAMGFRIMEGNVDISDTVAELKFYLSDGLVYSCEMTFEDETIWTGTFTPLAQ